VAVRAAVDSHVGWATIIVLQRDVGTNSMEERSRAQADIDGNVVLQMPRDAFDFKALVPAPGSPRDQPKPGHAVPVRAEWENGDPQASSVRLVLETGWKLDLRLVDAAGQPRQGVGVTCGGRSATSDADGRCTLLDLPLKQPTVTVTLHASPEAKAVTEIVDAPEAGRLVRELELSVP
jgi:hypothetical protein